ncbi:MAG: serine dehydratase subunit alpha family protein, partial [Prevotella sp.]|nr:serine dehydratase subunit alpha family protein [Prevotella sp.]
MIDKKTRQQIIDLVNQEVVPVIGCTEPMAVALCTARATEVLGRRPERIEAYLSANILKNAMGVGIPGTGMIGLPIAIALGAIIGKSKYQLEVIKDLTPDTLEQGKQYINEKRIGV